MFLYFFYLSSGIFVQVFFITGYITLNLANKKTNQYLSDFQTGSGAGAYATLDMEQLVSHTKTALVDIITSLQDSDGGE